MLQVLEGTGSALKCTNKKKDTDTKAQSGSWTSRAVLVEPLLANSFTYYTAELVASSDTAEKYILSYM